MDTPDLIGLIVNTAVGVVSVSLGIFAIILTWKLSGQSQKALQSVNEVATEIKSLVGAVVEHQTGLSNRMLDGLIDKNTATAAHEEGVNEGLRTILREELEGTEQRIRSEIEGAARGSPQSPGALQEPGLSRVEEVVREEISDLIKKAEAVLGRGAGLPSELRQTLLKWANSPAHYVLVYAIVRERAETLPGLRNLADTYQLGEPLEIGVEDLIEEGLLAGDLQSFSLAESLALPIRLWVARNEEVLSSLPIDGPVEPETLTRLLA